MAAPRVFISSTCYDLADERDGLNDFCGTFGFDTTLSERGDVFYHPDLHTHSSCIRETSSCHLFILIIGGRFGGKYKIDPTKSITNAEYAAAIQNGTPVFTFVKQEVLNDHNIWQKNRDKPFVSDIVYPSIEKQEYAEEIFKFIDSVRHAEVNNGLFGFRLAKDIYEILRKQWASMMFEYLQNRSISKQMSVTNDALGNLAVVSGKIEELVKSIYKNIDTAGATTAIENIENEGIAEEFFSSIASRVNDRKFIAESRWESDRNKLPVNWWEFLLSLSYFELNDSKDDSGLEEKSIQYITGRSSIKMSGKLTKAEEIALQELDNSYRKFLSLSPESKSRLISKYLWTKEDANSGLVQQILDRARKADA